MKWCVSCENGQILRGGGGGGGEGGREGGLNTARANKQVIFLVRYYLAGQHMPYYCTQRCVVFFFFFGGGGERGGDYFFLIGGLRTSYTSLSSHWFWFIDFSMKVSLWTVRSERSAVMPYTSHWLTRPVHQYITLPLYHTFRELDGFLTFQEITVSASFSQWSVSIITMQWLMSCYV